MTIGLLYGDFVFGAVVMLQVNTRYSTNE